MLPKEKRVNRAIFKDILEKSKTFHSSYFSLRCFDSRKTEKSRFSFVVSKKVENKATKRNILKRRGYNSIKPIYKNIKPGFYCVFFLKKEARGLKSKDFEGEMGYLLKKAGVLI